MRIRAYTESDLDALRRMHASQGYDYPFPDLSDPIFISKLVVEDDDGRPVMAALARLTCEMYLLVDRDDNSAPAAQIVIPSESARLLADDEGSAVPSASDDGELPKQIPRTEPLRRPRNDNGKGNAGTGKAPQRWARLLALHRAGERDLLARGLDDAHAWLPPQIAKRFGRRLESLGWLRDDAWTPYCKRFNHR